MTANTYGCEGWKGMGAGVTASEAKGVGEAALNRLSSQVSVDGLEFAR